MLLAAEGAGSGPIANACTHTAFHTTPTRAQDYLAAHPTHTGRMLSQAEALTIAESEFGPLLRPWDPVTDLLGYRTSRDGLSSKECAIAW